MAKIAAQIAAGRKLVDYDLKKWDMGEYIAVKEAVLPFNKFPQESIFLSPEMKSTGEVMGISKTFGESFRKASISAKNKIPEKGTIFISVNDQDKLNVIPIARDLYEMEFNIIATIGTTKALIQNGIPVKSIFKVGAILPAAGIGTRFGERKQFKYLGNKPLFLYTLEQAKKSNLFTHVVVSSDSNQILKKISRYNVDLLIKL